MIEGEALGEIIDALVAEHQAALLAAGQPTHDSRAGIERCRRRGARWRDAFREAGLDSPELDARVLRRPCARPRSRGARRRSPNACSTSDEAAAIAALAARRLAREPVARILGTRNSGDCRLRVTDATLVPRPETETVVEAALAAIDDGGPRTRALRIADLGTGTGALLLALLSELPHAFGVGTDVSVAALATARDNAERARPGAARARFRRLRLRRGARRRLRSRGRPIRPISRSGDIAALAPEVRRDPRRALDGGADGLDCYRAIAADARRLLAPAGHLVVELGVGQAGRGRRRCCRRRSCAAARACRSSRHSAGAGGACCLNDAMTERHCGQAKKHLDYRPQTD